MQCPTSSFKSAFCILPGATFCFLSAVFSHNSPFCFIPLKLPVFSPIHVYHLKSCFWTSWMRSEVCCGSKIIWCWGSAFKHQTSVLRSNSWCRWRFITSNTLRRYRCGEWDREQDVIIWRRSCCTWHGPEGQNPSLDTTSCWTYFSMRSIVRNLIPILTLPSSCCRSLTLIEWWVTQLLLKVKVRLLHGSSHERSLVFTPGTTCLGYGYSFPLFLWFLWKVKVR